MLVKCGMNKYNFWYAVATLVGSTVGVGIFGLPYVFAQAGLIPALLFLTGLFVVVVLLNTMYGEIILRTTAKHQIIGYAEKYLGSVAKKILLFTSVLTVYGALLAYIVVSGSFLANLFSFFSYSSPTFFSSVFFLIGAIMILVGIRMVSRFDLVMLGFFVSLVVLIAAVSASHINFQNYLFSTKEFWFRPFGVILFALNGLAAIPLMVEAFRDEVVLSNNGGLKLKRAILWGTLIPALLYLVFTLAVVGVSGQLTSQEAFSGLAFFLGQKIIIIGSIFAVLSVSTSFLGLGLALRESFQYDFQLTRFKSWLIVVIPPYVLFLLGIRDFIGIIGLVGGLALSVEGIFLLFLYMKARKKGDRVPEYSIRIPRPVIYFLICIFAFAAIYTLVT